MKKKIIIQIISLLFILLFTYAGSSKLFDLHGFRVQLNKSSIISSHSNWISLIIPFIELLTSILLAFPKSRMLALYSSLGLMLIFIGYIIIVTRFAKHVPCSCGGVLQNLTWNQHLLFNIIFAVLATSAIILNSNQHLHKQPSKVYS
jgi:uncharacterized membrane protein YphA (DoxX/SURF4 family)